MLKNIEVNSDTGVLPTTLKSFRGLPSDFLVQGSADMVEERFAYLFGIYIKGEANLCLCP